MADLPEGWALVVGGSGGLGSAICTALARDGRDVLVGYGSRTHRAEEVAAEVRAVGQQAQIWPFDLGDPASFPDPTGLSSLCFAAGPTIPQPYLSQTEPEELARVFDQETLGFFRLVRWALPALRQSRGSITALVTAGLERWPPGDGLSVIPKAAIQAAIVGLAREEGRFGVRANAVGVGVIDAGMFHRIGFDEAWLNRAKQNIPLGRFGTAAEIGSTAAFLMSDGARYLTGQTIIVDGGYTA